LAARALYARVSAWLALLAALGLGAFGLYEWIFALTARAAAVGPEIAAAFLLALISFLLSRVRPRRK